MDQIKESIEKDHPYSSLSKKYVTTSTQTEIFLMPSEAPEVGVIKKVVQGLM